MPFMKSLKFRSRPSIREWVVLATRRASIGTRRRRSSPRKELLTASAKWIRLLISIWKRWDPSRPVRPANRAFPRHSNQGSVRKSRERRAIRTASCAPRVWRTPMPTRPFRTDTYTHAATRTIAAARANSTRIASRRSATPSVFYQPSAKKRTQQTPNILVWLYRSLKSKRAIVIKPRQTLYKTNLT